MNKAFRLCLLLCLVAFHVAGQINNDKLITGDFKDLSVPQFVQSIESQSGYFFYYDSSQSDSVRINLSVKDQPLKTVLELAFKNTGINFSIDRENHIFLTKKLQISTQLAQGFYNDSKISSNQTITPDIVADISKEKQKSATSENKLYEIGTRTNSVKPDVILTGYIKNSKTGEPLVNATIFIEKLRRSVTTDQYGYYSLTLPKGNHLLNVYGIGMKDAKFQLILYSDGRLDIELNEQVNTLKTVVVSTQRIANVNRVQMGIEHLNIGAIKRVPTVFGEADVLKVVTTLPGVKTVGEASSGFNVRGGSTDQNLILFNDATIYNPSHFFGLFSAFNPEILKGIELYKSSIPSRFGGRLSSVLDISTREGNKKEITGSAGLGVITSRFNIEGPIVKDRTSFIFAARTTYAGWLLNLLPDSYKNSQAGFNDFNLSVSHRVNSKNDLYFTGYYSHDRFNLANDTTYKYNNKNISLKWKHAFNNKLSAFFITGYDSYQYAISSDKNIVNAYKLSFDINQANLKANFNYYINSQHSLEFGLNSIFYKLHPGSYLPDAKGSLVTPDIIPAEQALENSLYISDKYNITQKLSADIGLRYTIYNYLGPQNVNIYADGLPKEQGNLVQVKSYGNGSFIKTYQSPEYRLSLRYAFTESFSFKASYNTLQQYIHMLSNTTAIAPTDIWKLSDVNIKPQHGDQISAGLYKNLKSNIIELSVEAYYKRLRDYLDYKPGASLVMNHTIETDVQPTKGKAYGIEFLIKKEEGKLNGWMGYTYSRVLLKSDDSSTAFPVNHGNYYPANYDKPHDFILVSNFKVNHRFSLSVNVNYSTGRPITVPIARYYYMNSERVFYSDRNAYRIPDYFRTDFSINLDGNHKVKQRTHNSWTIGLYNVTGRKNPYTVYFVSENGLVNGYKLSIFGSVIPFVNFNIKF